MEERAKTQYGFPIMIESESDEKLEELIGQRLDSLLVDDSRCNKNRSFVECWRYLMETRVEDEKFNKMNDVGRRRNRIYEGRVHHHK